MDIVKICAVGLVSAFCVLILRETKSEAALIVGIAGGCIIILMLLEYLLNIFSVIGEICDQAGINSSILALILKIVGVGYIAEFSASIIEESGSKALSDKIILAGKVIIVVLSLPIIQSLFGLIANMLAT